MSTILETRDLVRKFGELVATDHVSLQVSEGEFLSIIGPNGAGKTTLFNLISGRLRPTAGAVVFLGDDITNEPPYRRVRRGLARSFQITNVFADLTVLENVTSSIYSRRDDVGYLQPRSELTDVEDEALGLLEQVGLADEAAAQADALSHGQRRRLELGIILGLDPSLILLDEPTAGMSDEDTDEIIDLITDVGRGRTMLLVEHDMRVVMDVSDRITVLHQGCILEEGTPEEIRDSADVREVYLDV